LITDDTGTIGHGRNQAEFSVSRDRESSPGDGMHARTVAAVYTRGLSDNLDLYFGTSHASCREHSTGNRFRGLENPVVGVKWRFYESTDTGNSLVLKPELSLPVSERNEAAGLGSGKASGALMAVLTHEAAFGAWALEGSAIAILRSIRTWQLAMFPLPLCGMSPPSGNWLLTWVRSTRVPAGLARKRNSSSWVRSMHRTRTWSLHLD
jgi:hypothetical protein